MRRWLIQKLGGYPTIAEAVSSISDGEMKEAYIEKLGGYATVEDALESVRHLPLEEKHKVLTQAVKRLFNTIDTDDILKIHASGHWTWKGKPMRDVDIQLLKAEAVQFRNTRLWEVLQGELVHQSRKKMFINSASELDLVAGKLLVYYIDIITTRLKRMLEEK